MLMTGRVLRREDYTLNNVSESASAVFFTLVSSLKVLV